MFPWHIRTCNFPLLRVLATMYMWDQQKPLFSTLQNNTILWSQDTQSLCKWLPWSFSFSNWDNWSIWTSSGRLMSLTCGAANQWSGPTNNCVLSCSLFCVLCWTQCCQNYLPGHQVKCSLITNFGKVPFLH